MCTSTTVTQPTCEYQVGKWCSNPIPDWNDKKSCLDSWSQCSLQSASCFSKAGFPDSLNCFKYQDWCSELDNYCLTKCVGGKCGGKSAFQKICPAQGGKPAATSMSTYPCPQTIITSTKSTTVPRPTSSCPVAAPTGICSQATNSRYGYGAGKPVGGIALPVVTCNNIKDEYNKGNVYKLYTEKDSRNCPSYRRPDYQSACADACKAQYQQCESTYAAGCKSGRLGGSYQGAHDACASQYRDCLGANRKARDTGYCATWTDGCR
ncbi:hypothetical protein GGR50DRAFT_643640 [Xylaria sp. CBS 124048]|nr:hypothetical protein GGR50DRAFT_643640 [Xylaria sp. CBS 124048]